MIPFHKSLGFRILTVSFILLTLPLLVDSFILVRTKYEHAIDDAKEYLVEMAQVRELPLSQLAFVRLPTIQLLIAYLGLEQEFPQQSSPAMNEKLKKVAQVGEFYGVFLVKTTSEGKYIVVDSGESEYIDRDYTEFFTLNYPYSEEILDRGYTSYIYFDNRTHHPFVIIIRPIYSEKEKQYVGLIAFSKDVTEQLKDILEPDIRQYQVNFALLHPSSIVLAASDTKLTYQHFFPLKQEFKEQFIKSESLPAHLFPQEPLPIQPAPSFPFFEFMWQGQKEIGYLKQAPGANYELMTYASKDEIYQMPLVTLFNVYSIYGIILVIGGSVATFITMRMAKPIQDLSMVMQKIQQGSLQFRYKQDPLGFEINTLGSVFNQMVDTLLEQKRIAEEERVNREVLVQELKLGQQAQASLLPRIRFDYPGVDLAIQYIPAIEVGGDFFDLFVKHEGDQEKLVLSIADASGKGVYACFYSLSLRNMLRTYIKAYSDIAEAMAATNDLFRKDTGDSGMFVTVLSGIYDYKSKSLSYYSCGHNPALVRRKAGYIETLEFKGIAMGVLPSEKTTSHTIQLHPGDVVLFYTDGITEAHNLEYQFFGEERLQRCLEEEGDQGAKEIVEGIVARVSAFAGEAPQHDDMTLLVMKILND